MKPWVTALWYAIPVVLFLVLLLSACISYYPNTVRQNDSAALGRLRRIAEAQHTYAAQHRGKGFACRLEDLSEESGFSGYRFFLRCPSAATDGAAHWSYEVRAEPLEVGKTGFRAYCSTESGVIWYDSKGSGKSCIDFRRQLDLA